MTDPRTNQTVSAARECAAEFIGTYILVFFGVGALHASILTGAQSGAWQVAAVWGVAVSLAVYTTSEISGAHINPAITCAFAALRGFPWRRVPRYVLAQVAGAFAGAATLYGLFHNAIRHYEIVRHIVRGRPGSELSAMVFGQYFPNPAIMGPAIDTVSTCQAFCGEAIGTAFLALFVFAATDPRNRMKPNRAVRALFIGLVVAVIISVLAPLTQAGLNPARDFGPRLFAWMAGWGHVAIPGPRGGFFTVYVVAPLVGGLGGGFAYEFALRPSLAAVPDTVAAKLGCGRELLPNHPAAPALRRRVTEVAGRL